MHVLENFQGLKIRGRGLSWSSMRRTLSKTTTLSQSLGCPGVA